MTQSVFSKKYANFRHLLVGVRKEKGFTQEELAVAINRPQSFVSKCENGERRLDLIEFLQIMHVLDVDPFEFIRELENSSKERTNV
jgi:transcriptional regulator with XRE-family HTH domain